MLASLKWLVMRPCRHPELPQPRSSPTTSPPFLFLPTRVQPDTSGSEAFSFSLWIVFQPRQVPPPSRPGRPSVVDTDVFPHPPPQAAPCLSVFLPMVANACWYDWSFPLSLSCSPAAVFPPKHSSATSEPGRFVQKLEKCQKANLSFFDKVRFRNIFFSTGVSVVGNSFRYRLCRSLVIDVSPPSVRFFPISKTSFFRHVTIPRTCSPLIVPSLYLSPVISSYSWSNCGDHFNCPVSRICWKDEIEIVFRSVKWKPAKVVRFDLLWGESTSPSVAS